MEKKDLSSTFQDNMSLPIHRWYRYTAGFSAEWVEQVVSDYLKNKKTKILLYLPLLRDQERRCWHVIKLVSPRMGMNPIH